MIKYQIFKDQVNLIKLKSFKVKKEKTFSLIKHVSHFILGQGVLQIVNLVVGLFIIRWLTKEQYAQYSMAFAFQTTAQMLVEFGFSSAIIALVGARIHDKDVIGEYIVAGRSYRTKTYLLITVVCCIAFPLLSYKQHWPIVTTVLLLLSILSNLYFSGWVSYYKPALQIHKRISSIYKIEVSSNILRGILLSIFHFITGLYSWIASAIASLMVIFNGIIYKKLSKVYVNESKMPTAEAKKEMLNYISPIIPGIIFSAFQSQITLFIISVFGKSSGIAEIGALGRLGQLFTLLNMASTMLIAPFIARQENYILLKRFIIIFFGALTLTIILSGLGFVFPQYFLLILGEKYNNLQNELSLVVLNACIGFLNGLLWSMNSARKWLFKWMPAISIPGSIIITVIGIITLDLSVPFNVLLLSICDSIFILIMRIAVSTWGFKYKVYAKN